MISIEGMTIVHVIVAVLGILMVLVGLVLLIIAAIKDHKYPPMLISVLVVGLIATAFPVTKKLEFNSALNAMNELADKVKENPDDREAQKQLEEKVVQVNRSKSLSTETIERLNSAIKLIPESRRIRPLIEVDKIRRESN